MTHDLLVIGSGPGGYRAAVLGALRGLRVAIVERGVWGGCCLNRGCVPKKAWYATARDIAARRLHGAARSDADLLASEWARQRAVVERVRSGYLDYLDRLGVVRHPGAARLLAADRAALAGGGDIRAGHVVIATGAAPWLPAGIERSARVLTTDDLFERPLPTGRRVAVLGGGGVGTELAWILARLGCGIRWYLRSAPLARHGFTAPARKALVEALHASGVEPQVRALTGARTVGDSAQVSFADGAIESFDWVLAAFGRRPNTHGLGLESLPLALEADGRIATDACQRTSLGSVYAIGDVTSAGMTANLALADARVAIGDIVAPGATRRDHDAVPEVVYSALELARIGLDEERAEAAGREPATGFAGFGASPQALAEGDEAGYVRLVADQDDGTVLGAEIVGTGAGELINLVGLSLRAPDALRRIAQAAWNHPSRAEELANACDTLAARWGLANAVYGAER